MADQKVSLLTGEPMNPADAVDTTTGTERKISLLTGEPMDSNPGPGFTIGGPAGFTSSAMSTSDYNIRRKDDISKYQKYDVPLSQDLDWDEIRARNQSTAQKWGYGISKALTTTVGAVAENTLGVVAGLGSLATGGAYWDNVVGRNIDNMNEYMRENMPNYMTEAEQNMGTMQRMGTANFWADTVANGLGYSVGSIATMFLTGGVGAVGMAGKLGSLVGKAAKLKSLYGASKAIATGTKLAATIGKGAKGARVMRFGQALDAGLMMSLAESSVEARETYKGLQEDLTQQYLQSDEAKSLGIEYDWQIPDNIQDDIEKNATAAGNTNFGFNLAVTSGTNMFAFGKAALGYRAARKASKDVTWDVAAKKAINKLSDASLVKKGLMIATPIAKNGMSEAVQEGAQFASNIYSTELYASKYHDGGVGDRLEAFNKAMSETIGSQEGRESMLVGLLTGMIMGGAGAIKSNEYKARNESADALTNIINTGYFDSVLAKAEAEQGATSAIAKMQDALEKGDIKRFKDSQQDLIIFQGMQALDHGGFEVMLEKLEDSKSLNDSEFAQMYGYSTEALADGTSFSEISGGESKAQVVDNLIEKMQSLENTYQNVNERFAVREKTKGLPRLLMSEEQRNAEDKAYNEQLALRDHLIYKGAHIVDRTARQKSIESNMQELIDNDPVLSGLGINVKKKLSDASQTEEDFEFTEDDPDGSKRINKRQQDSRQALVDVLNQLQEQVKQEKPDVLDQFIGMANNYLQLNEDTNFAINAYNKLASDPQYRKAYQNNIDATKAAMAEKRMEQKVTEVIDQSETSQAIADAIEGLDTTDEQKARLRKKFKELRNKERAAGDKFLEAYRGSDMTPQQVLDDLKAKKTDDLTPVERAGLAMAIASQENHIESLKEANTPQTKEQATEERAAEMQDAGIDPSEPDPALDLENLSGVEAVSEDGRMIKINGKIYYNQELNPTDAIERTRAGRIRKVRLVDEKGNRHTFYKESIVDAIAYHIMLSEAAKIEGQPTLEREQALVEKRAAEEALEKVATKGKHGPKTTESLHQEIYDLERLLEAAQRAYDNLKQVYITEAGATKEDLKNDPELAPMAKNLRSLRSQIAARKRVLKARGESPIPTQEATLRAENRAQEMIDKLELQVEEERQNYSNTKLRIEQIDKELAEMQNAPRQEQLSREFDERRRALTEEKRVAEEILKEIESEGKRLQALIKLYTHKLKRLKDELSEPQSPRKEAESTDAENAQRQNAEAENRDRRESSKAEGPTIVENEEESERTTPTNDQVETEKEVKTGPRKAESQPGAPEGKVVETINFDQDPAEQESQQQEPTDEFGAARDAAQKEAAQQELELQEAKDQQNFEIQNIDQMVKDEMISKELASKRKKKIREQYVQEVARINKKYSKQAKSDKSATQNSEQPTQASEVDKISNLPFKERIPALIELGIIASDTTFNVGKRFPIIVNVNGVKVGFFRSSAGTGGKQKGAWTPMFGFGKDLAGNTWLIKGNVEKQINVNYNSQAIKEVTDILNNTLNWDHSLDKGKVKDHPFFKVLKLANSTEDFNNELYGVKDLNIVNYKPGVQEFINSKLSEINKPTQQDRPSKNTAQKEGATADLNAAQDQKVGRQVAVIKNILDESESVEDAIEKLLEGGHIVSFDGQGLVQIAPGDTAADPSRDAIYFKINGVVIPMYRSSKGTSDKKAGEWYPFFFKSENWVAKGLANNYKEGYGNPELKAIADALNDNVQYSTPKATYELDPIAGIQAVLPSLSEAEAQALYLGTYGELHSAMVDILQNWNSNIGKLDLSSAIENLKAAKVSNPNGIGGEIESLEQEYAIFDKAIAKLEQMAKPESQIAPQADPSFPDVKQVGDTLYEVKDKTNVYIVDTTKGTIQNKKTGKTLEGGAASPVGNRVVSKALAFEEAAQNKFREIRSATAVPPPEDNVGPTLSVKMAKDSAEAGIQQITDRQGNERYVLVVTPNGIAETNYDNFNGTPLISDTNLAVHAPIGTEVEFEIIENSFFVEKYGEDASPLDHVADVPVYVKIDGQRIGKLEASNSTDRANIVRKLAAGERVTSAISNKLVGAASVNHTRVTEGVDSPAPYFNNPSDIFNNEVLQGEPLKIAVVSDALGAKSWLSGDPGLDSDIASSRGPKSFNNLASGQVGFVVQSPDSGDSGTKVIVGSTAALTPAAQNAVLDNLKNNNFDNAKEIVAHSKADDSVANPSYLSFGEFKDGQQYLVYKSPATGELVRINAENIAKAANNGSPTFSFVKFNPDTGKFAVIPNNKKLYETMAKDGMLADFKNFLKTKKFQVSVDRANLDAPYTSRVTNTEYSSYQDYLFSPTETGTIDGRFGHSSIVATDVSLVNGSIFNNPTVEFSLGDIQDDAAEVASEFGADKVGVNDLSNSALDDLLGEDPLGNASQDELDQDCPF